MNDNLDSNDSIEFTDEQIDFDIQVWRTSENRFDFEFSDAATLDIDTYQLPDGLTLDADNGVISGLPAKSVDRTIWIQVQDSSRRKIDANPQTFAIDYDFSVEE